ncbi:hypothetical protein F0562_012626 [Nyssa sinensis]|uniref:Retrotransposon Copia-like N-terminal domain-containing protein n=1 Tax=Nyssa sinensis TaxID=561372 RepID=A0A5J4ZUN5_9ASTE|nr:hypothetical protein F0562_012626 [Nyssa sinensis]
MVERDAQKSEVNKYDNPNDPFYLHQFDQLGVVLVTQPLNEENYGTESRAMIMALSAKNKESFINGTIQKPSSTSTTKLQQWARCNNLVKSWLLNSISYDIGASVIYNEDEKQRAVSARKATGHDVTTFAVRNNSHNPERNFTPKNPHLKCEICDKVRHISETCRAHLKCDYYGWKGHTIDTCRKLQKVNFTGGKHDHQGHRSFAPKANHVDTNAVATTSPTSFTLIGEQYQNLMALLSNNTPNSMANHAGSASAMSNLSGKVFFAHVFVEDTTWILDIGATDHMICSPDLLTTSSPITN